jgi:hypothetical protein
MGPRKLTANPLFPFTDEVSLIILSFLTEEIELGLILLTCLDGQRLAAVEREQRLINVYKEALEASPLWRYLPLIDYAEYEEIKGLRFLNYLEMLVGTIPPSQRATVNTFSHFRETALLSPWLQTLPSTFSEKFPKARMMAGKIMLCYQPEKDPEEVTKESNPQTLVRFMKSVDGNFSDLELWENYSDLYKINLCLALAIKLSWAANEVERLYVISDPVFSYFVNGKVLCLLNDFLVGTFQQGLIMGMLHEAVRLHGMPNKQPTDALKLQVLEHALARLNEDDWVRYFTKHFENDKPWRKRNTFAPLLQQNYPFLQQRLTEKVLLTITEPQFETLTYFHSPNYSQLVLIILINPELRKHLSQRGLVTLLKRLPFDNIPIALADAGLAPVFTSETLNQWLDESKEVSFITHAQDGKYFSWRALCILTNANLLNNFKANDILFFAKQVRTGTDKITKNVNFIHRVIHDPQANELIMALCKLASCMFAIDISGNKELVNLLTPAEIVRVGTICDETRLNIAKNEQAIAKLSNNQFWKLIELAGSEAAKLVCKNNFLEKLDDEPLRKFEYYQKTSAEVVESIRCERIRRYDLRKKHYEESFEVAKEKEAAQAEVRQLKQFASQSLPFSQMVAKDKQKKPNAHIGRPAAEPKPAVNQTKMVPTKINRHHLKFVLPIIILSLLTLLGLGLIATGVGCSIGIPLCIKAAALLFSWVPISPVISLVVTGVLMGGISFIQDIKKTLQYKRELSIPSTVYIPTYSKPLPLKPLAPILTSDSKQMDLLHQELSFLAEDIEFLPSPRSSPGSSKASSLTAVLFNERPRSKSDPVKFECRFKV